MMLSSSSIPRRIVTSILRPEKRVGNDFFPEYSDDPFGFAKDILGIELWEKQRLIAESLRDFPQVAVSSCYASGKTFLAGILVMWWLYSRDPSMVVTTAPSERQVKELLWRYVRKLHSKSKIRLGSSPKTMRLEISPDRIAMGFSGTSNSVQGFHEAKNVLFIIDEACSMNPQIVEDFSGITAGSCSRRLDIGNPTCINGHFYRAFNEDDKESEGWKSYYISAYDIPNISGKGKPVPGLLSKEWLDSFINRYGKKGPQYCIKVLGQFWVQGGTKVIEKVWLDNALGRDDVPYDPDEPLYIGVDVGYTRDETVFAVRRGRWVWVEDAFNGDSRDVVDRLQDLVERLNPDFVAIDATGAGVAVRDVIREREDEGRFDFGHARVKYVTFCGSAKDKGQFRYILDEMQWSMRKFMDPEMSPPFKIVKNEYGQELCEHLLVRGYELDNKGRICVESKRDLKKRSAGSPDFADALMVSFVFSDDEFFFSIGA